jgi:hypothetical protein
MGPKSRTTSWVTITKQFSDGPALLRPNGSGIAVWRMAKSPEEGKQLKVCIRFFGKESLATRDAWRCSASDRSTTSRERE